MITNQGNLVLADAAPTPVSFTFTPASRVADNTARWVDRNSNSGMPLAFSEVTLSVTEAKTLEGVTREKMKFSRPKIDSSIPTKPVLLGTARAVVDITFHPFMTDQDRKDFVEMLRSALARNSATALGDNIAQFVLPY